MAQRTAKDTCLLCQQKLADKLGSHYTPASIIKKVIGERNYEEAYEISAATATTSSFMGRSNLKNTNTTIKKSEHVEDYIFCTECEKKLGDIEGICSNGLNTLVDTLIANKAPIKRTSRFNKYSIPPKLERNHLIVYFYSIIWRQCIHQFIDHGTQILSAEIMEKLGTIVQDEIYKETDEILNTDISGFLPLSILTTYHRKDITTCFINPNTTPTNPELFYIGPYAVLLWHDDAETPWFSRDTGMPVIWKDKDLQITRAKHAIIGVIQETVWNNSIDHMVSKETQIYIRTLAARIAKASGLHYAYCRMVLLSETNRCFIQNGGDYIQCINQTTENILASFEKK